MDKVEFEVLLELPRVVVVAAGPVMLSWFDGLGDMPTVLRVQKTALALARSRRRSIGSLVVVGDGKSTVNTGDNAARADFLKVMKEVDPHIFATAVVIASGGFGGAALRAFVSGVSLAARAPYPLRVFDSFAGGRDWLLGQPAVSSDRASISPALDAGHERARRDR